MTMMDLAIRDYTTKLAGGDPTPGGGSAAALSGALAAALCAMTARLTVGREKYRPSWPDMERVECEADQLAARLLELADEDSAAYEKVMAAYALPKNTEEEKAARRAAAEEAIKGAALVPLETLKAAVVIAGLAREAAARGNPNCLSDAGVAALLARAAATGAAYNVRINLGGLSDRDFISETRSQAADLLNRVERTAAQVAEMIENGLE